MRNKAFCITGKLGIVRLRPILQRAVAKLEFEHSSPYETVVPVPVGWYERLARSNARWMRLRSTALRHSRLCGGWC